MIKGVYVLETHWSWDKSNTEYGTFTVEEGDGFDRILDPSLDSFTRSLLVYRFKKLAEAQDGSTFGKSKLVRLYKIDWADKRHKRPHVFMNKKTGHMTLRMRLKAICDFDELGNPIPVQKDK